MNWEQIRGNWNQAKGELKMRWGKLTDDDLTMIDGERDKLVGSLQVKYGITKEEAMQQIDDMS
ncbi:CsbD family protein [Imhoffiella purpurea]|nr:CsbD family protein [Imhoffiella purpurea]